VPSSEYLITTTVLTQGEQTVTFSNLSQYAGVYRHLQFVFTARDDYNALTNTLIILINGAASGNYSNHYLFGNGSSVASTGIANTVIRVAEVPENQQGADIFGAGVIDILDPFNTSKFTTVRSLSGHSGSSPRVGLYSGAYLNTAIVDSVTFDATASSNFLTGSRFSLYGVTA
jgi:hypothetical protein